MTAEKTAAYLEHVPAPVRRAMLADRASLAPGAAAVTGRFFRAIKQRREPMDMPGSGAFLAAARSESTLATLLRALHRYAPTVSTANGRALRKSYYRQRSPASRVQNKTTVTELSVNSAENWPATWRVMWPALFNAPIRASSKMRYRSSIARCADVYACLSLPPAVTERAPGFYVGIKLGEAFLEAGVRHRTVSGYLDGLVALISHGEGDLVALDGLRAARDHFKSAARRAGKLKTERIRRLKERGGFAHIIEIIGRLRDEARDLPDHSARAEKLQQMVAVLMLLVNKPARAGDLARWRLGRDLCRSSDGRWTLNWLQSKAGGDAGAGTLWPETGEILDELVLRGRPSRMVEVEYCRLAGLNLLTGAVECHSVKYISNLVYDAVGVPAHDLRTLAADYLRMHNPATAAATIQSHLGHGTRRAGNDYAALAEGDAATASWRRIRNEIAGEVANRNASGHIIPHNLP